jgi:hypothetical protein
MVTWAKGVILVSNFPPSSDVVGFDRRFEVIHADCPFDEAY